MSGTIYTFYSYKGGVGRSMALANIGMYCFQRGLTTLMIDWDLEAPGLERYFEKRYRLDLREVQDRPGLCDMLMDYMKDITGPAVPGEDELPYPLLSYYLYQLDSQAYQLDSQGEASLWLMHAGRRTSVQPWKDYVNFVQNFDWTSFYEEWEGGLYLEWLREELKKMADVILIDSRTGVTEMGGVATQHLADAIIMLCGANLENIENTARMGRRFTSEAVTKARGNRQLDIVVAPSRIDKADQQSYLQFIDNLDSVFEKLPMRALDDGSSMEDMTIPYMTPFSYRETLIVGDQNEERYASNVLEAYSHIFLNMRHLAEERSKLKTGRIEPTTSARPSVFVAYTREDYSAAQNIMARLSDQEVMVKGSDQNKLRQENITKEIAQTTALIVLLSSAAIRSRSIQRVASQAEKLSKPIIPLILEDSLVPPLWLADRKPIELQLDFEEGLDDLVRSVRVLAQRAYTRDVAHEQSGSMVYVSHSREDREFARRIAERLREDGFRTWIDRENIPVGTNWADTREKALIDCDAMVVLLSPALAASVSGASTLTEKEWAYMLQLDKPLIPLLIDRPLRTPLMLADMVYIDLTRGFDAGLEEAAGALRYEQLDGNDSVGTLAVELLARAAFFAPGEPIPRDLLRSTLGLPEDDPEAVRQAEVALDRLAALDLLETQEDGALRLRRSLAAYVQERVAADAEAQIAVEEALLDAVKSFIDEGYPAPLLILRAHLWTVTDIAKDREDERAALLCNQLGRYLRMIGDYAEAHPYLNRALEIRETVLGHEHPNTAESLNNLALLLRDQGKYEVARPLFERALEIRERVLGPDHPETAESLNNLAMLLRETAAYVEARPYLERALEIRERVLGPDHPETADSLSNLGKLLYEQGAYAEARSYVLRALEIREKVLGEEHPATAVSLNHLAALLLEEAAYAEARSYALRALEIQEKMLGEEHLGTASSLNILATVMHAEGAYAEARAYLERTLEIRERVKGEEHPATASSLNNLAALLYELGAYAEARPYLERSLKIYEKVYGEEHPATAIYLNNLAMLLLKQGKYEEARPLFERALEIQEKVLGEEHPHIAESFNNLATLLRKQANYAEACRYIERALEIQEKMPGPDHPDTARTLNNLALLLYAQGDYSEARPLFERALEIRERVLGEHTETAESLNTLAALLREQGEYEVARPLFERALEIREKVLGPDHPDTPKVLNNLALLLYAQGDYSEARPLFERALEIRERVLGEHTETAESLNNLALLLQDQGKHSEARPLFERALEIREKVLGPDHPETVASFNSVAMLYQGDN